MEDTASTVTQEGWGVALRGPSCKHSMLSGKALFQKDGDPISLKQFDFKHPFLGTHRLLLQAKTNKKKEQRITSQIKAGSLQMCGRKHQSFLHSSF